MVLREKLSELSKEGKALLATNFYNFETLSGVVQAAAISGRSIILQLSESSVHYLGLEVGAAMARAALKQYGVEGWLHLDHGSSIEMIQRCLDAGFDSVMIDASEKSFEENVKITSAVVKIAAAYNTNVEAELGYVAKLGQVQVTNQFTQPEEAARFVEATGVNALAVAIGSAHGFYKETPRLQLDLLERIHQATPAALVLHGSSGIPDAQLQGAIARGISKVNLATEIKDIFMRSLKNVLTDNEEIDLRKVFPKATESVRALIREKLAVVFTIGLLCVLGLSPVCSQSVRSPGRQYVQNIPGTGISFEMVFVPSGSFLMGSPENEPGRHRDEGPQHRVSIDSLWVGRVEVTWDLYELFLAENRSLVSGLPDEKQKVVDAVSRPTPPFEDPSLGMGRKGFPAVNVSPHAALAFCKWLSLVTGRFYRLPSEAEWEYLCRAGSETAYSFGNDIKQLDEYAVYYDNSNGQYAQVATRKPNAWGLYDMHGNVAEWTLDEYSEDMYAKSKNASSPWNKPTSIYSRVYRGGSWDDEAGDLRSAARKKSGIALQRGDPQVPKSSWWYTNASFIGFRLVSPANAPTDGEIKKFWAIVLNE